MKDTRGEETKKRDAGRRFGMRLAGLGIPALVWLCSAPLVLPRGGPLPSGQAKEHPLLPDVKTAKCLSCHDDLTTKKVVHAPLGDGSCDTCHEMENREGKTLVQLAAGEKDLCLACHSGIEESLGKTHVHAAAEESCGTCHSPHSSDFEALLVADYKGLCLNCHDIEGDAFKTTHGRQPVLETGCGICHDAHGSDGAKLLVGEFKHAPFEAGSCEGCHRRPQGRLIRLRGEGAALCYACHSDKEGEFAKASPHTPVKKGECTGCHDPHMAANKAMLKEESDGLCLGCHSGVAALMKAKNVHAPAEDSCLSCHDAHAADYAFDLTADPVEICLACHDSGEAAFQSAHYKIDPEKLRCGECHNPHGSDGEKMLNAYSHAPFAEKECETCHSAAEEGPGIALADEDVNQVCFACHDDMTGESNEGLNRHAALDVESCTVCHSPHASSRPHLVKERTPRLCASCHDDVLGVGDAGKFVHGIIETSGCEACHLSHYSKSENLLVEMPNGLCLACHLSGPGAGTAGKTALLKRAGLTEEQAAAIGNISLSADLSSGHPQARHPVAGSYGKEMPEKRMKDLAFEGDLSCLSCHSSHAGAVKELYAGGLPTRTQVCLKCHRK